MHGGFNQDGVQDLVLQPASQADIDILYIQGVTYWTQAPVLTSAAAYALVGIADYNSKVGATRIGTAP